MSNNSSISFPAHIFYNNKYYGFELFTPKLHQNSFPPQLQLAACILQSLNSSHYQFTLGVAFTKYFMQYELEDSFLNYTTEENDSKLHIWAGAACYRLLRLRLLFINSNNEIKNVLPESFLADTTIHPLFVRLNQDNSFSALLLKRTWTLTKEEFNCPELDFRRLTEEKQENYHTGSSDNAVDIFPPISRSPVRVRSADTTSTVPLPPPPQSPVVRATSSPPSTPPRPTTSSKLIPVSPAPVDDQTSKDPVPIDTTIIVGAAMMVDIDPFDVIIESPPLTPPIKPKVKRRDIKPPPSKQLSDPSFKAYLDAAFPPSPPTRIPTLEPIKKLRKRTFKADKSIAMSDDEKMSESVATLESPQVSSPSSQTYSDHSDPLPDVPMDTSPVEVKSTEPVVEPTLEVSKSTADPIRSPQVSSSPLQTYSTPAVAIPETSEHTSPVQVLSSESSCDSVFELSKIPNGSIVVPQLNSSSSYSHCTNLEAIPEVPKDSSPVEKDILSTVQIASSQKPKSESKSGKCPKKSADNPNIATVSKSEEEANSTSTSKKKKRVRVMLVSCTDTNVRLKKLKENDDDDNKKEENNKMNDDDDVPIANLIIQKKPSDCSRCRETGQICSRSLVCSSCKNADRVDACCYDDPSGELLQQAIQLHTEKKEEANEEPVQTIEAEEEKEEPMQVDDVIKVEQQQPQSTPSSSIPQLSPAKPMDQTERQESFEARVEGAHQFANSQQEPENNNNNDDEPPSPVMGLVSRSGSSVFHSPFTLRGASSFCGGGGGVLEPLSLSQSSVNNNNNNNNHHINLNINSSRSVSLDDADPYDNHSLHENMYRFSSSSNNNNNNNNNNSSGNDGYPMNNNNTIDVWEQSKFTPEMVRDKARQLSNIQLEYLFNARETYNIKYGKDSKGGDKVLLFTSKQLAALNQAILKEQLREDEILPFIYDTLIWFNHPDPPSVERVYRIFFNTALIDNTVTTVSAEVMNIAYPGLPDNQGMKSVWKLILTLLDTFRVIFPQDWPLKMKNFLTYSRKQFINQFLFNVFNTDLLVYNEDNQTWRFSYRLPIYCA